MKTAAIALDLGTTSIKAARLTGSGTLEGIMARPAPEIAQGGGRYESDAPVYVAALDALLERCLAGAGEKPPVGLSCQRSSFLIWDASDGRPVSPLISWQDTRGQAACRALAGAESMIRSRTGLALTPYYLGPKLFTVFEERPDWLSGLIEGPLRLGTLDSYVIWRWTGGKVHQTDVSMAARTLLMDLASRTWSKPLCDLFRVPRAILPEIRTSAGLAVPLQNGLTLTATVADQSAALYAGLSDDPSEALVNLGTGGFVVRYLPALDAPVGGGYLKTLVYEHTGESPRAAVEGTINSIAAALAPYPFRECRVDDLAQTKDICCVAEPSGIGAPYFRADLGLRFSSSVQGLEPRQVAALLLEGIIFRVARILEDLHRQHEIRCVYLSGGLSALPCLQRGIARCCPYEVRTLRQAESSLIGAGLLAAGMSPAAGRASRPVAPEGDATALLEKYARWKTWLDGLLAAPSTAPG